MEIISRFNVLQENISNILKNVSDLKAENEYLTEENSLLTEEVAQLKERLNAVESSTAQYVSERNAITERVESLIKMLD